MYTDYVYLLHFSQPISPDHTCQHYMGSAADVNVRLVHHLTGKGARLCQVANERGLIMRLCESGKPSRAKGGSWSASSRIRSRGRNYALSVRPGAKATAHNYR